MFVLVDKKANQIVFQLLGAKTEDEAIALIHRYFTNAKVRDTFKLCKVKASTLIRKQHIAVVPTQVAGPHKDQGGNYQCKRCGGTGTYHEHGTCYNCGGAGTVTRSQAKALSAAHKAYLAAGAGA